MASCALTADASPRGAPLDERFAAIFEVGDQRIVGLGFTAPMRRPSKPWRCGSNRQFEDDGDRLDGWTVSGAPQDEAGIEGPNRNDWVAQCGLGIKEGAAVATPRTLYLCQGFEGISDAAKEIMERALGHLLPPG